MVRPPDVGRGFSGPRAAEIAGITYRQLDYWARTGLVVPSLKVPKGSGDRRRYSVDDVRLLALLGYVGEGQRRLVAEAIKLRGGACRRIVVDITGNTIYCIDSDAELVSAVKACSPHVGTMIDVDAILPELADAESSV
jgi:hypothetical protein